MTKILSIQELIEKYNVLTESMAIDLATYVRTWRSILVVGNTGVGKSTILAGLSRLIPEEERVIYLAHKPDEVPAIHANKVTLNLSIDNYKDMSDPSEFIMSSRPNRLKDVFDPSKLIMASLRMRPNRLVVDEMENDTIEATLKVMGRYAEGSMAALRASSIEDALTRLESVTKPTVDVIVDVGYTTNSLRQIRGIYEVSSLNGHLVTNQVWAYSENDNSHHKLIDITPVEDITPLTIEEIYALTKF